MTRLLSIFTLLITLTTGYMVWAEMVSNQGRLKPTIRNPKLADLAPDKTREIAARLEQKRRAPASARVIDPDSGAKVYLYGACRAPHGMVYGPSQEDDYQACMNSEAPYNDKGLFHSKAMGIGFIID